MKAARLPGSAERTGARKPRPRDQLTQKSFQAISASGGTLRA
jgi:hypothetical protein